METLEQTYALAVGHHRAGRAREAEALYRQVLARQPNHAGALHMLGMLAHQLGQHAAAVQLIRASINVIPHEPVLFHSLGVVHQSAGQLDDAIQAFGQAAALQPGSPEAQFNVGVVLEDKGLLDQAVAAYRRAVSARPDFAEAWNNLGHCLQKLARPDEAIAALRRALSLRPDFPQALNNLGNAFNDKEEYDEAARRVEQAIALRPDYGAAHYNMGIIHSNCGRFEQAVAEFRRASALGPDYSEALNNLGDALREMGKIDEAAAAFQQALAVRPNYADARWNLGLIFLLRGDFARGWPLYEARWEAKKAVRRPFAQPMWDGRDLAGRRILLHAEQGFGDTIQMVRYVPEVSRRGGRVILECPRELTELLNRFPEVENLVAAGEPLPPFDVHCPLMSVPAAMGTTLETIPAPHQYITPDPAKVELWRRRLATDSVDLKVGVAWMGRPKPRHRSIPLELLQPLFALPGVRFFSLQQEARVPGEMALGPDGIDWSAEPRDFSSLAGLIANLDLVISIDTALAHLAGAMGKPTWILIQHAADWRWLLNRKDSPWYPTMQIFRQARPRDWTDVLARVIEQLAAFLSGGASDPMSNNPGRICDNFRYRV